MNVGAGLAARAGKVGDIALRRYRRLALTARGRRLVARLERSKHVLVSRTPHEVFLGVDDELWLWLNTEGCRISPAVRDMLPRLPDNKWQMKLTGLSGDATLQMGHLLYSWFKQIYSEHAGGIARCRNVLDFGCGWGRIIRFFLKDLAPARTWGVDVVAQFIRICRETNRWSRFEEVSPRPPSTFDDGMFDLIFCNSVFSHFSEEAHEQWLATFRCESEW